MIGVSPDHRVNIKYQAWRGKPTMKDLLEAQERGRFLHLARTMLLHAHQQWVSSNGKVGERLDLSGVDLRKGRSLELRVRRGQSLRCPLLGSGFHSVRSTGCENRGCQNGRSSVALAGIVAPDSSANVSEPSEACRIVDHIAAGRALPWA